MATAGVDGVRGEDEDGRTAAVSTASDVSADDLLPPCCGQQLSRSASPSRGWTPTGDTSGESSHGDNSPKPEAASATAQTQLWWLLPQPPWGSQHVLPRHCCVSRWEAHWRRTCDQAGNRVGGKGVEAVEESGAAKAKAKLLGKGNTGDCLNEAGQAGSGCAFDRDRGARAEGNKGCSTCCQPRACSTTKRCRHAVHYAFRVEHECGGLTHLSVEHVPGDPHTTAVVSMRQQLPPPRLRKRALADAGRTFGPLVIEFCKTHLGKQVGDGECWTLAALALKAAGARPPRCFNFGQTINPQRALRGDIVQFVDCDFKSRGNTVVRVGDPFHVAIFSKHLDDGSLKVFEQNGNAGRVVAVAKYRKSDWLRGKIQLWRPVPTSATAEQQDAKETV
eukprot:m.9872 g.9872  ORF g.9872 m.9872 type:complete len:391 (-) comp3620_c0_seq1:190-1362(-)